MQFKQNCACIYGNIYEKQYTYEFIEEITSNKYIIRYSIFLS